MVPRWARSRSRRRRRTSSISSAYVCGEERELVLGDRAGQAGAMTLTGLYVPLITPFDPRGVVALDVLEALAHQVLDTGATGLVALGTTGEPAALTPAERRSVMDVAARVCRERHAPLLAGAHTPEDLRALGERPEVTAALSVVPPFARPGEAGVLAYFTQLASGSPVPLVVYDLH